MEESFCALQAPFTAGGSGGDSWSSLPDASRDFFERLGLHSVHPLCQDYYYSNGKDYNTANVSTASVFDTLHSQWQMENNMAPLMGPAPIWNPEAPIESLVTTFYMIFPPAFCLTCLWVRLLAGFFAPIGVAYLAAHGRPRRPSLSVHNENDCTSQHETTPSSVVLVGTVVFSLVVMTDSAYVLELGPRYGVSLFCSSLLLAFPLCYQRRSRCAASFLISLCLLSLYLTLEDMASFTFHFGYAREDVASNIDEGIYYDSRNGFMSRVIQAWPEESRTYSAALGATKWMITGDARTGLPYLFNNVPTPKWHRAWIPVNTEEEGDDDGEEYLALDISFPTNGGGHDSTKPLYLVFHGLNGGSEDGYVKDLAVRRNAEGSTVIVMVARGIMDTPVRGWTFFHAARISDAHTVASWLKNRVVDTHQVDNQLLVGVGYSIGAIVLSNYVASYGSNCALDVGVSISGALDARAQQYFQRSRRVWQPLIAAHQRDHFLNAKWGQRILERLGRDDFVKLLRSTSVVDTDRYAGAEYNNYEDLEQFYEEMSALGDIPMQVIHGNGYTMTTKNYTGDSSSSARSSPRFHPGPTSNKKVSNISIPFLVLQALDDPVTTWRCNADNLGLGHPEQLVQMSGGNLVLLLTEKGGHVGWPLGWWPSDNNWKFMSNVASGFVNAIVNENRHDHHPPPQRVGTNDNEPPATQQPSEPVQVMSAPPSVTPYHHEQINNCDYLDIDTFESIRPDQKLSPRHDL